MYLYLLLCIYKLLLYSIELSNMITFNNYRFSRASSLGNCYSFYIWFLKSRELKI